MKLKNIIFYFPNFSEGGVENTSIKLSNYFTTKNINITFISFKHPNKKKFKNNKLVKFKNYRNRNVNWLIKNVFCLYILAKSYLIAIKTIQLFLLYQILIFVFWCNY